MKRMSSWLLIFFMAMFWIFRIIVAIETQQESTLGGFVSFNFNIEIITIFITIACFILILRRNLIGAVAYLGTYIYYFGSYLAVDAMPKLMNSQTDIALVQNAAVAALGILIALFVFIDVLIDRKDADKHKDKKTDWFFEGDKFDRKLDDRADKNQYRNY